MFYHSTGFYGGKAKLPALRRCRGAVPYLIDSRHAPIATLFPVVLSTHEIR